MSFNIEKLQQYANEKGYVNMTMSKRREPGQYGDTHYFTLNEWKPEGQENVSTSANSQTSQDTGSNGDLSIEDIPF